MTDTIPKLDMAVEAVEVSAYTIPTDFPEADGTYDWDSTTVVLVKASAGGERGLGYAYADVATAHLAAELLAGVVRGRNPINVPAAWAAMVQAVRNLGRPGICLMAVAAVDACLWDPAAPRSRCGTWSISTTMCVSSICCSTAFSPR
jgi:L-alanine-DL-glutamate epimerase-like enolase superfamily enzyme